MKLIDAIHCVQKDLRKNALMQPCKEMAHECVNCDLHVLQAYLNWYVELLYVEKKKR